jgi:pimeloyl-ACP methyl ester carboxylesterase
MVRVLKIIGPILLGVAVLLYLVLPAAMGIFALLPARQPAGSPPEGFEAVSLTVEDGVALQAWYHPPANGIGVILLHRAGSSRDSLRPYASMLTGRGYGVLAIDLRGHGESQGATNRLAWQGTADVGTAVSFLQGQSAVQSIAGLGISAGGEALLGASARYPEIRAIAADGATRRCTDELLALESERPLVRNFTARVMFATVQVLSGQAPPQPLLEAMLAAESTRFLLIAGGGNPQEVAFNELFARTLGGRAALWVAPQAEHTAAFRLYPQEYEQRLAGFFGQAGPAGATP